MTDELLAQMFLEREQLTPDAAPVAGRIREGIARRRRRRRTAQASVAAFMGVLIVVTIGWSLASLREAASPPAQPASTTPAIGLVPAVRPPLYLPVSPGWLPGTAADGPILFTIRADGVNTMTWSLLTGDPGDQIAILVATEVEHLGTFGDPVDPGQLLSSDERQVDVHGRTADRRIERRGSPPVHICQVTWLERKGLAVRVVVRQTANTTELTCEHGEHMAASMTTTRREVQSRIRLGLVPVGYILTSTTDTGEAWCRDPRETDLRRCVSFLNVFEQSAPPGSRPVTVRGHSGWIDRTGAGPRLQVSSFGMLSLPDKALDPDVAGLTDQDLIRMVEASELPGSW